MTTTEFVELHDARLIGISFSAKDAIRLDFCKVDGSSMSLMLTGVTHFFCTGMLEGNIVLGVEVLDPTVISEDDLNYFVGKEGRGTTTQTLKSLVLSKQLSMLLLSPSYGAELGCVCAHVSQIQEQSE